MASVVNGFKGDGSDNDRIAAWLYDAKNEYNCNECPYEREHSSQGTLPCGEYNCWVTLHVAHAKRRD